MLSGCSEIDDAYNGPVRAIWDTLRSTAESSSAFYLDGEFHVVSDTI